MSELTRGINAAANALADKTVVVMRGIPNKQLQKKYLRELLNRIGGYTEQNTGMALNTGKALKPALAQAYAVYLQRVGVKKAEGLGRWKQDWAGLQGLGDQQNAPAGSTSTSSSPFGSGAGGVDLDAMQEGIEQVTETVGAIDGLIDAVGNAYGSLTDVLTGETGQEEDQPIRQLDMARVQQVLRAQGTMAERRIVSPDDYPVAGGGGLLGSLPTWALAGGAAVAAGLAYYLFAGKKK